MHDIRKGLKRGKVFPSWGVLRSIGNSRAAKLTILIPLVGYFILLNDTVIKNLELSEQIFGVPTGATLTKLLLIYCGLVCVAVASAIFAIWCPLEVKRYASAEEYIAGEETFQSQRTIGVVQNRLMIGDDIARAENAAYIERHEARPTPQTLEELRRRARDLVRVQLNLYYEMLDRSRWTARWAAALFYLSGLTLLVIPSAMVFWKVMSVLLHRLT